MRIKIGGHQGPQIAEVTSINAQGTPGCGIYVLYLSMRALVKKLNSEALISQLSCRIDIEKPFMKLADGVVDGNPVLRLSEYHDDFQLGFLFYLSGNQINNIEIVRNSGDLKLNVWLSGVVEHQGEAHDFRDKGEFVIPKQKWLEALSAMGYKDTLLFELPMPDDGNSEDIQLKDLLQRAQSHILNGHYQESIGLCRQAIELVENDRGDKTQASEATKKYKNNRSEMSINERMLFLREGLKNITHLGAHNGDEFSRQQAQAVLGMTISLLSTPEVGFQK